MLGAKAATHPRPTLAPRLLLRPLGRDQKDFLSTLFRFVFTTAFFPKTHFHTCVAAYTELGKKKGPISYFDTLTYAPIKQPTALHLLPAQTYIKYIILHLILKSGKKTKKGAVIVLFL